MDPLDSIPEHEASKVHFSTDVRLNTEIAVRPKENGSADVHLGFLSIDHTYEASFCVPNMLGKDIQPPTLQMPGIEITNLSCSDDLKTLELKIELQCRVEGKLKKSLTISNNNGEKITITVYAKVMARHRGTPMLKNNIRCIHVEPDSMSDVSDWQGFE